MAQAMAVAQRRYRRSKERAALEGFMIGKLAAGIHPRGWIRIEQ
jgi:hypothetical protein